MIAKALRDEGQYVQSVLYIANAKLDPRLARHGVGDTKVVETAPDECGHILASRQTRLAFKTRYMRQRERVTYEGYNNVMTAPHRYATR